MVHELIIKQFEVNHGWFAQNDITGCYDTHELAALRCIVQRCNGLVYFILGDIEDHSVLVLNAQLITDTCVRLGKELAQFGAQDLFVLPILNHYARKDLPDAE